MTRVQAGLHKASLESPDMYILMHVNKSCDEEFFHYWPIVTFSLTSPSLQHSLVAVRLPSLWQPWHQQRASGQVLFTRGSKWKEEMEDKKQSCVWGTGRNERGGGRKEYVTTIASLLYVTRATAACRPACLPACDPSIPGVSLLDEARALGQPGCIFTSTGSAPPHLLLPFLCPHAAFLFDS